MQPENDYLKRIQKEREKQMFFDETATSELVKQYTKHQPFLLSALKDNEELRSRVAFVDVWKKEFKALHKKLKELYGTKNGEFSYLKDPAFFNNEVYTRLAWFGLKKDKLYLPDMMKDYLTYLRVNGTVSDDEYKKIFKGKRDETFRTQTIVDDEAEWDFLIDRLPKTDVSGQQKKGLRECRKWMYRNCPKGGALNNTGHKRNYIDAFGKKPLRVQLDTLFLLENKLYKETAPDCELPDDFTPELDTSRKKMTYSRWKYINPLHLWWKFSGTSLKWERMEAALKRAERREKKRKRQKKIEVMYVSTVQSSYAGQTPERSVRLPTVGGAKGKLKATQFAPKTTREVTFENGSDIALLIKSGVLLPLDTYSAGYSFLMGAKTKALNIVGTVSGSLAIFGSAFSAVYGAVRAKQSANGAKTAEKVKENVKKKGYYPPEEQRRLHDMAKISQTRNEWKLQIYGRISGYGAAWLLVGIPAFCGVCSTIFGVAGGVISVVGAGVGLWLCREANKKTAEKAVILAMKAEDGEYKTEKANRKNVSEQSREKDKYIKSKIAQHKKMLKDKLERLNPAWTKIVTDYVKSDRKIKDRVLENWAVDHRYPTIYSVLNRKDTGNTITALRYVLLKRPNEGIEEGNLIKKEDVAKYFSEEHCVETGQTPEMVRTRIAYRDMLDADRIDVSPPKNCKDVLKRMNIPIEFLPKPEEGNLTAYHPRPN